MSKFSKFLALVVVFNGIALNVYANEPSDVQMAIEKCLIPGAVISEPACGQFVLSERMSWYRVPGLSLAVIAGGELVFAKAYGKGITTETLFQSASLSKPVTAVGVMRLVDQGRLDLDMDINLYLRSWRLPAGEQDKEHPVTIRGILAHTAGLTVHGFNGYAPGKPLPSLIEILNGAGVANSASVVVDKKPSESWRYSGGGYVLLQQLLEDVTGQLFRTLMRDQVLDPAGMTTSSFSQPNVSEINAPLAAAHDKAGNPRATHVYPEEAPAGLWATPTELGHLLVELMAAYKHDNRILTKASMREMAKPVTEGMGLGFASDGEGWNLRLSHGGSNKGFKALMFAYPERGEGMVLMTNGDGGTFLQLEIARALAAHFGWPDMEPQKVTSYEGEDSKLLSYEGVYRDDLRNFEATVRVESGNLHVESTRGSRYVGIPTGDGKFITRESGSLIEMTTIEGGVTVLRLWGMEARKRAE